MNLLSENELSELNIIISTSLKNWTILKPMAERYLYSLAKLDGNQFRIIGEIVKPKDTHSVILKLQKILNNTKEKLPEESDDLFKNKDTFENDDKNLHEEILLSIEDHTNADKHDLGKELCWGQKFLLCERTGSKSEDIRKVLLNTLKVQKTLKDMHRNLFESISAESSGTLSKPVLHANTKLLVPGFLSLYFFLRIILIIYIGGEFYVSVNLADFYIPTKYEELESILKISHTSFQIK
ncbi:16505_t:CDS:2, partial [Funneliformis mosseae]